MQEMNSGQDPGNSEGLDNSNWLLVGLGNPGDEYQDTRHNLGFMLIDLLAREFEITVKRIECRSRIGQASIGSRTVEFAKPQTYMNLSGEAVNCLIKKDGRSLKKTVIIVDDLALPFGTIRLRRKGSDGGHNGLKSIIECAKTEEFIRLRIGIQPEYPLRNAKKFVLERFSKKEFEMIGELLDRGGEAIRAVISDGIDKAMSEFNATSRE